MKQPWWLINTLLLFFLCVLVIFMMVGRARIPTRISIEPVQEIKPPKREMVKIDLGKIYSNDLFDTYQMPVTPLEPEKVDALVRPMPAPPTFRKAVLPPSPPPRFLEPLSINLKGVVVGTDERLDVAIIEDSREKRSKNYRVSDKIDDAQLIKIYKNKIILIRSNGQQETLYVSQYDAELEELMSPRGDWSTVIQKIGDRVFKVDLDLFAERVHNLAQFIDLLNITTVYQQGASIGCRIGKMQATSPGMMLGLMPGDIIYDINGIDTTTVSNRLAIYQQIISLGVGGVVTVKLLRRSVPLAITYHLAKLDQKNDQKNSDDYVPLINQDAALQAARKKDERVTVVDAPPRNVVQAQRIAVREQQGKYGQTFDEFKRNDKRMMVSQRPLRSMKNQLSNGFESQGHG